MLNEKLEQLSETRQQLLDLRNKINEQSNQLFTEFRKEIFDKYPELESFGWSQYTPYFNDGDTCVFSSNTNSLTINGDWSEDCDWISDKNVVDWGKWNPTSRTYEGRVEEPNPSYNKELSECHDEIVKFLSNFDDEFYLSQFGDHAEIIITKDSLTIEDCDHD